MKKIKIAVISLMVMTLFVPTVASAKESVYYTNLNGVEMTEKEYNNLRKIYTEDTIATLEKAAVDAFKNEENLTVTKSEKYIQIDEYLDRDGNVIASDQKEVTKEEAEAFAENQKRGIQTRGSSHQTNMKKIVITGSASSASIKTVTVTNTWLSIPSVKSYDVIAFGNGTSLSMTFNSISGYQKWDGNTISYNSGSQNTKKSASGGVGVSMNIVDEVKSSLQNSLTVTFYNGSNPYTAYGTYQHATQNVTLAQSQNYSFSRSGLGKVLNFSSSVKNKYDGMQGVNITFSLGDW